MTSISIGTWDLSQLDDVMSVLNAASPIDQFQRAHVQEAVFGDVDHAPDLLLCAQSASRIVAAAAAVPRRFRGENAPAGPVGFVKLFAVAPSWQGQGVGSRLLAEVERRLAEAGARSIRVFGDAPFYLRPGVDFRLTRLVCLLRRRGYRVRGEGVNMDVDLASASLDTGADEARLGDLGFVIRRLGAADADAFRAYMERDWSWGWAVEACRSLARDPISTHVALQDGQIVGFASCNASGPGQFGPMGVRSELRRHGIGAVVLKRCLADLRDQGYPTADIQWVGPIDFYAKQVGAVLSRCFWQFEKAIGGPGTG